MFRQLSMPGRETRVSAVVGKGALLLVLLVGLTQSAARADLSDYSAYAVFGRDSVSAGNNVTVSGGFVGSNGTVTFGNYANVTEGVNAATSVTFGASPFSTGAVYTGPSFIPVNPLTPVPFTPGADVLSTESNESLLVGPGDHYYGYFIVGENFHLNLDPNGGKIRMFFGNLVSFGNRLNVTLLSGSAEDIYAQADASWTFLDDSNWVGTIYAPNDAISARSGFTMTGALYGYDVALGADATITGQPFVIPAPGAVVLGAIGIGMVGWLTRRAKLAQ